MELPDALKSVGNILKSAHTYSEVFGALPTGEQKRQIKAVKTAFHFLARQVHPDKMPRCVQEEANDVFVRLKKLHDGALRAIAEGTYEKGFVGTQPASERPKATFEMESPMAMYQLSTVAFRTGDFSVLYRGTISRGTSTRALVLAKIAADPTYNGWLEREGILLSRFRTAGAGDPLAPLRSFVPELIDSFVVMGDDGRRLRVEIHSFKEGYVSLAEIMAAYPRGLDPKDASWIWRRVLAQTLAANAAGVVHGALTPDHVLVHPVTREPLHIGWVHATGGSGTSKRITHVVDRWRDYYPPEVFDKKDATHQTDLYMAGKVMVGLLTGEGKEHPLSMLPAPVREVVLSCLNASPARRPKDARDVLDRFTRAIRNEWGKLYRPLVVPV